MRRPSVRSPPRQWRGHEESHSCPSGTPRLSLRPRLVVGRDDALHDFVAHDISAGKLTKSDALSAWQNAHRFAQAGGPRVFEVNLRRVASDNAFRLFAETRQE